MDSIYPIETLIKPPSRNSTKPDLHWLRETRDDSNTRELPVNTSSSQERLTSLEDDLSYKINKEIHPVEDRSTSQVRQTANEESLEFANDLLMPQEESLPEKVVESLDQEVVGERRGHFWPLRISYLHNSPRRHPVIQDNLPDDTISWFLCGSCYKSGPDDKNNFLNS